MHNFFPFSALNESLESPKLKQICKSLYLYRKNSQKAAKSEMQRSLFGSVKSPKSFNLFIHEWENILFSLYCCRVFFFQLKMLNKKRNFHCNNLNANTITSRMNQFLRCLQKNYWKIDLICFGDVWILWFFKFCDGILNKTGNFIQIL